MSVIRQVVTDIHGKTTITSVRPNRFEDFLLEMVYRRFGRNAGWRLAHRILRRKGVVEKG